MVEVRRRWRWAALAATVAVLVALPFAAQLLPSGASAIGAQALLRRIDASGAVGYSGYAQSQGGVSLPVSDTAFSDVSDLLGGTKQVRVWWRGPSRWRADTLDATGEDDVYQDATGLWSWDYEANTARRLDGSQVPMVRVPRTDDLLPGPLARRLLSEVRPADVTRLADARIAGRSAAGLRVHVSDPRSTIEHIDVWALPDDGLPVRVSVWGTGPRPLLETSMLDLSLVTPSVATTSFTPAPGAQVQQSEFGDIVGAIDHFGASTPPAEVAGLARRRDLDLGAVGVYGRGVTLIVAMPLPGNLADQVVAAVSGSTRTKLTATGISAGISSLNLQLSNPGMFGERWLLVGTVTRSTLAKAVTALPEPQAFGRPRGRR